MRMQLRVGLLYCHDLLPRRRMCGVQLGSAVLLQRPYDCKPSYLSCASAPHRH